MLRMRYVSIILWRVTTFLKKMQRSYYWKKIKDTIRHLALTGSNRGDRHNRDILMNSSYLGIEGTAEYLEELIRRKFGSEEE